MKIVAVTMMVSSIGITMAQITMCQRDPRDTCIFDGQSVSVANCPSYCVWCPSQNQIRRCQTTEPARALCYKKSSIALCPTNHATESTCNLAGCFWCTEGRISKVNQCFALPAAANCSDTCCTEGTCMRSATNSQCSAKGCQYCTDGLTTRCNFGFPLPSTTPQPAKTTSMIKTTGLSTTNGGGLSTSQGERVSTSQGERLSTRSGGRLSTSHGGVLTTRYVGGLSTSQGGVFSISVIVAVACATATSLAIAFVVFCIKKKRRETNGGGDECVEEDHVYEYPTIAVGLQEAPGYEVVLGDKPRSKTGGPYEASHVHSDTTYETFCDVQNTSKLNPRGNQPAALGGVSIYETPRNHNRKTWGSNPHGGAEGACVGNDNTDYEMCDVTHFSDKANGNQAQAFSDEVDNELPAATYETVE